VRGIVKGVMFRGGPRNGVDGLGRAETSPAADLSKQPNDVACMFDQVAKRYDLMNDLASLGRDRQWRRHVVEAVAPRAGEVVLDLAAGTGTSSDPLRKTGARVVSTDLSFGMVSQGKQKHPNVNFVVGDALHLPFRDEAFDASTVSFGLRNIVDVEAALKELFRVTRSGGTLVICEFSTPTWKPFRAAYHQWLAHALPLVSMASPADPTAYSYLAESILAWPGQSELAARLEATGWVDIEWRNLTGGVVALHRAVRP